MEEYIALTDPKLSLLTGDEEEAMSYDERLQFKITHFRWEGCNLYLLSAHVQPYANVMCLCDGIGIKLEFIKICNKIKV